jgi:preprotein translocase subunit SecA
MCVRRAPVVATSKRSRSAITNGSKAHQKGDERSAGARRFRDLVAAFSADLGDDLSEADMAAVRTAAALTLKSEQIQADLAAGIHVDSDALIRLASTSRRALAAVSAKALERKPASTMTLADYMAAKQAEHDALADDDDHEDET